MQCIQDYGGSSSSNSSSSSSSSGSGSDSEPETAENTAHLRPIDTSHSVAKTLTVMAAPDVVPMVSANNRLIIHYVLTY